MDIDLNKIKSITWATVIFIAVTIIFSGVLFIFSFSRELFFKTELAKLILLSISITTPFWLLNTLLVLTFSLWDNFNPFGDEFQTGVIGGSIISIVIFYFPILAGINLISVRYCRESGNDKNYTLCRP